MGSWQGIYSFADSNTETMVVIIHIRAVHKGSKEAGTRALLRAPAFRKD